MLRKQNEMFGHQKCQNSIPAVFSAPTTVVTVTINIYAITSAPSTSPPHSPSAHPTAVRQLVVSLETAALGRFHPLPPTSCNLTYLYSDSVKKSR